MKIGSNPTSIQKAALPHLLHPGLDRDILIQAQTGSGKTLTYLLPIVQSLLPLCEESFIDRSVGTLAIVLAPTRELARQIYEVFEKLINLALSLKEQNEDGKVQSGGRDGSFQVCCPVVRPKTTKSSDCVKVAPSWSRQREGCWIICKTHPALT